jgi:hypothetical protein
VSCQVARRTALADAMTLLMGETVAEKSKLFEQQMMF